jgi:hypothetical protein
VTVEQVRQLAEALRCAVTICRCADWGCAHPGATIMPPTWRCPACAVYWALVELHHTPQRIFVPVSATPEDVECGKLVAEELAALMLEERRRRGEP